MTSGNPTGTSSFLSSLFFLLLLITTAPAPAPTPRPRSANPPAFPPPAPFLVRLILLGGAFLATGAAFLALRGAFLATDVVLLAGLFAALAAGLFGVLGGGPWDPPKTVRTAKIPMIVVRPSAVSSLAGLLLPLTLAWGLGAFLVGLGTPFETERETMRERTQTCQR